jgi:hypothetical protein
MKLRGRLLSTEDAGKTDFFRRLSKQTGAVEVAGLSVT